MVNCSLLFKEAEVILKKKIADRLVVLERGIRVCKFRLYIREDLFVQVYRNDIYNTTDMASASATCCSRSSTCCFSGW
ncbi:hypothetical protein MGLY_03280 [Neomoorella glycerini]|uniref:Uncharacterized protein n=1 Tax=Neomoorella glycerini TaxID=55779 RepID=A0A6I5ZMA3_9FIRM|nr:hypothetical protein MGLY_03280 [Moorella glycerini]